MLKLNSKNLRHIFGRKIKQSDIFIVLIPLVLKESFTASSLPYLGETSNSRKPVWNVIWWSKSSGICLKFCRFKNDPVNERRLVFINIP